MPLPNTPGTLAPLVTVNPYDYLSELTREQSIDMLGVAGVFLIVGTVLIHHERVMKPASSAFKALYASLTRAPEIGEWK